MPIERRKYPFPKPGRAAGLMLLALLWVQLGIAAHQFDHVTDDLGDYCEVCLKFDRAGDAVSPAEPGIDPVSRSLIVTVARPGVPVPEVIRGYRSRAPPFV